jgi:alpha-L-fucosidase
MLKFSIEVLFLAAAVSAVAYTLPVLPPMPPVPAPLPAGTVPMGNPAIFTETNMDFAIETNGPFQPTWSSIAANYPANPPDWLRQAKFGIWVHYGPEAALASGDWSAQHMYQQGAEAYNNHLSNYGYPTTNGYKDVIHTWSPTNYNPAGLAQLYYNAGARFLLIQGVHHDQFDEWNSTYNPWNAVNFGPRRDTMAEWTNAVRSLGMHFGVAFHHEYGWWWYQPAYLSDTSGPKEGVPYDALTATNGTGTWWQNYDLRRLYLVNLQEYEGVSNPGTGYFNPSEGIFTNHLDYAYWYATQWALRIIDVIQNYDPDFIYADGNSTQPFSGYATGTGYYCDAMERVMAHYYNEALLRRGQVNTFSFVKFHPPSGGVATTAEGNYGSAINTAQPWFAETAVGDWYYNTGFVYDSGGMMVHWLLEAASRDGGAVINICPNPAGSLDSGATNMLVGVGQWMAINGEGIYGGRAWVVNGEGTGLLPTGNLGSIQANYDYGTNDFRFMVGSNGSLYAYCMKVPAAGTKLTIKSLGTSSNLLAKAITSVSLLGSTNQLVWAQQASGLVIICPSTMPVLPANTAVAFKIGSPQSIGSAVPENVIAMPETNQIILAWNYPTTTAAFTVMRSTIHGGPYTTNTTGLTNTTYVDTNIVAGTLYFYIVSAVDIAGPSINSAEVSAALAGPPSSDWLTEDVGAVGAAGSFSLTSNVFTIQGSGADIWYQADAFRYVFQALNGDCSITARVLNMQDTAPWAKAGVMIRETLDPASQYVINFISPVNGTALQQRYGTASSASGVTVSSGLAAPYWVRLARTGNVFRAYAAPDGVNWTLTGTTKVAMNSNVYVGLAVCSVDNGTLCQAQFDNVTFSTSAVVVSSPLPALIHRYSFNETSGTIAHDFVGGANGTLQGDAQFNGIGQVTLPGSRGSYVLLPGGLLNGLSNVTIEAWVTNAVSPDNVALFSFDDGLQDGVGGGYLRYVLHDESNGRSFLELASSSGSPLIPGYPGLGGQYVHVVCIYSPAGGYAIIYTNGTLETSQSVSTPLSAVSTNAAALGRSPWSSDPWLAGAIDEFRIYSGELLPADIAAAQIIGPNVLLTTNVSLVVSQGNGTLAFNWPVAGSDFTLEWSPTLGRDAVWTVVDVTPAIVGTNNQVVVTPTNATMFFRLAR